MATKSRYIELSVYRFSNTGQILVVCCGLSLFLFLATLTNGASQIWLSIMILFITNYLVYKISKTRNIKVLWFACFVITLIVLLTLINFYNARSLGFNDGLLYGVVGSYNYSDMHNYYYEAQIVVDIWTGSNFKLWLLGQYPQFGFYGPYNPFNIFVAVLMLLFADNLIVLILLKATLSICSIYLMYHLTIEFFAKPLLLPVVLFNLFPGYLYTTFTLMRDNIIVFLVLGCFLWFFKFSKRQIVKSSLPLLICLILLFCFRAYVAGTVVITLLIYTGLITQKPWIRAGTLLLGLTSSLIVIYFYSNVTNVSIEAARWYTGRSEGVALGLYSFYYMFFGMLAKIEVVGFTSIYEIVSFLSQLILNIMQPFCLVALLPILKGLRSQFKRKWLIIGYAFPLINIIIITYGFGDVIYRLYNIWFWLTCMIIVFWFKNIRGFTGIILSSLLVSCTTLLVFLKTLGILKGAG